MDDIPSMALPAQEQREHLRVLQPDPMVGSSLAAGLAISWREHHRLLIAAWVSTIVLCSLAAWFGQGVYYFLDFRDGSGRWAGLFSVLSAGCLAVGGFAMLMVARLTRMNPGARPAATAWVFGGLGGIFLSLDDLTQIHESVARVLGRIGIPAPLGYGDQDVYVFAAYGMGALYAVWTVRHQLAGWPRAWLPGALAIACFAASQGVDLVPWDALARPEQEWWGSIEEVFKTLGCVNFALFGALVVENAARDPGFARTPRVVVSRPPSRNSGATPAAS